MGNNFSYSLTGDLIPTHWEENGLVLITCPGCEREIELETGDFLSECECGKSFYLHWEVWVQEIEPGEMVIECELED